MLIDAALPHDKRLARALEQLMAAELALFTDPESSDAKNFGRKAVYLAPHYDWSLALRNGITCGLFTMATAGVALACGWKAGSLAAIGVSIFGMILSLAPLPQKLGPKMTLGVLTGVALATAYRLWLQPGLHGPLLICMSVLPLLFIGGIARVSPLFAIPALDGIMCFLLASQAGMPATSLPEILNGSAALIAGYLLVTTSVVLWPRRPERQARLVVRKACRDLERLVKSDSSSSGDWRPKAARQILRLITHLGQAGQLGDKTPKNLLSLINLGHAISQLKLLAQDRDLHPADKALLSEVLAGLENLAHERHELIARLEAQLRTARSQESPDAEHCIKAVERTLEALRPCLPLLDFAEGSPATGA